MKEMSLGKLFISYWKEHRKLFFFYILSFLILIFIFSLYDNYVEGILYGMFLSSFLLLIGVSYDFYQYVKKHRILEKCRGEVGDSLEHLPKESTILEKDYQMLLQQLYEEKKEQMMEYEKEKNELEDYFTLWVHQMKLPIAGMQLLLQAEDELDVKLLKSELFRIQQYTDMVLAYVRMNSISTDYVMRQSDLDDMIRQVLRKFSGEFIRKKLKLDFKETKKKVLTDEKWLVFVLEQVISNALKYTKKGGIQIYLKDEDTLVIEDTGIGIDASDCYRVFEKGYTGLNGRYDKKASGIGLYLCKTIMTNLSHKIWLESELKEGTKVMLSFANRTKM